MPIYRVPLYLTCLLSLAVLAVCGGQPAQEAEKPAIRLGFMPTGSEGFEETGQSQINAARLAVEQVNQNGGLDVGGEKYPVTLITEDTPNSPEVAVRHAHKLINQDRVVALIGPYLSTIALPVGTVAEQARIPMISPSATNPAVTAGKRYVFRAAYLDAFQGQAIARFVREELGVRSAAVLYDVASAYNRGIAEVFRQVFEEKGGRIIAFESYTTGDEDFRKQLKRIKKRNPEALYLPDDSSDLALKVKQIEELGLETILLGSDGWDELPVNSMDLEGAFYSNHWHPEIANAQAQAFIEAYRMAYDAIPTARAALTYDAFGLLFHAIEQQGNADPESIHRGLANMGRYVGVSGAMEFTGTGDPVKSAVIVQIKDGKSRFYQVVEP